MHKIIGFLLFNCIKLVFSRNKVQNKMSVLFFNKLLRDKASTIYPFGV